jgi:ATP-dependent Clp protease ATP-binding subunit ClpC
MSEYQERHTVARMIGAPPGYVGHEEGGQLTEAVRRRPYSVVLLDEIEKAHPDVFNVLLQVLDDGLLTDSTRRKVNFKNTVIIMTSNLGARQITGSKQLGFTRADESNQQFQQIKNTVTDELKRAFNPEFLNRVDDVIVFHPLTRGHMDQIVTILLTSLEGRLAAQDLKLEVSPEAVAFLVEKGFDPALGARPLKRALQRYLEDPLSEAILRGTLVGSRLIRVIRQGDELVFQPVAASEPVSTGGGA